MDEGVAGRLGASLDSLIAQQSRKPTAAGKAKAPQPSPQHGKHQQPAQARHQQPPAAAAGRQHQQIKPPPPKPAAQQPRPGGAGYGDRPSGAGGLALAEPVVMKLAMSLDDLAKAQMTKPAAPQVGGGGGGGGGGRWLGWEYRLFASGGWGF